MRVNLHYHYDDNDFYHNATINRYNMMKKNKMKTKTCFITYSNSLSYINIYTHHDHTHKILSGKEKYSHTIIINICINMHEIIS